MPSRNNGSGILKQNLPAGDPFTLASEGFRENSPLKFSLMPPILAKSLNVRQITQFQLQMSQR
jgi:hypothetical protein